MKKFNSYIDVYDDKDANEYRKYIRDMYLFTSRAEKYFDFAFILDSIEGLNKLVTKLNELKNEIEERKNKISKTKELIKKYIEKNGDFYFVSYYTNFDKYNNGGVGTVLNENQLRKLCFEYPKKVHGVKVFFLKLISASSIVDERVSPIPDWLPEEYKEQLENPTDDWALRLLKDE